jgi:CheY-like chemotaxis protein
MLVVSWNSSTRNMLTGYLEAWGAEVSAAADKVEAQIYLKAHPTTVTTIISFSPPEHDLAALMPIVNFIATSITEVRFWIILCPISFIGKIRDLVAEMAKSFAAKGELLAAHAARSVTIMSKPVRQGVLYNCLMQLHANGVYRYEGVEYEEAEDTCSMPNDDEKRHSLDMSAGANSIVSNLESPWCSLSSFTRRSSPSYTLQSSTKVPLFKVLVAEDSKANQMALKSMLSKHGVVVTVVADGSEGVDLVVRRGVRFNLALFDINMVNPKLQTLKPKP